MINATQFVSDNADDIDNEEENISKSEELEIKNKVNHMAQFFMTNGLAEIALKEYKTAEKTYKENKQKGFLENFSAEELFVYNQTKEFINNYGFETGSQKSFLTALRNLILGEEIITSLTLDDYAHRTKKDLDKIFDVGQQGMVSDFAQELQKKVKEQFANKKKMKI
jgi:DNA-binding transcriptional regulator YhcF (GntR family)